jgi:two-component system sensor histidine kinase DesK
VRPLGPALAAGPWAERPVPQRWAIRAVWILFIVFPLVNAASARAPALQKAVVIACASLFVLGYLLLVGWQRTAGDERAVPVLAVMLVVASVVTCVQDPGWGFLYIYSSACCGLLSGSRAGFGGVALCTALAAVVPALSGGPSGDSIGYGASSAGVGMLMLLVRDLRTRNEELSEARAELAELAVARERERFARDLHDLLGHSLSVIAIKAELAGRLLPAQPERAAGEVRDVERVARQALADVREAVSGYRQPTLQGELAGARMALAAAGIEAEVHAGETAIGAEAEAVLAWAIREGATNVIRHSAARRCELRVTADGARATVEVIDDGRGPNGAAPGGQGLSGLRERVAAVQGSLAAGPQAGGSGYRLRVEVPTAPEAAR